ncbi:MAG: CDP-diacylglycerol--serine O-phosphatidyltransferase [Elusimicrobiota bacterium]
MEKNQKQFSLRRGIYILPSLLTSGNMAMGFISMLFTMNNNYTAAAWLIIAAIAFDVIDGRVARWTKTTSSFGIEFDSLADLVSFGVAPSLLMYQMVLHTLGKPGMAIGLFFVLAGAIRLARFNVKAHDSESSGDFVGLPIPAAAGILASFVLSYELFAQGIITVKTIPLVMKRMPLFFNAIAPTMLVISLLMVSSIPYMGFKRFKFSRPKSMQLFVFISASILLILTYPQNTIFIVFVIYILSGVLGYFWRYWRLRRTVGKTVSHKEIMEIMNGKKSEQEAGLDLFKEKENEK